MSAVSCGLITTERDGYFGERLGGSAPVEHRVSGTRRYFFAKIPSTTECVTAGASDRQGFEAAIQCGMTQNREEGSIGAPTGSRGYAAGFR